MNNAREPCTHNSRNATPHVCGGIFAPVPGQDRRHGPTTRRPLAAAPFDWLCTAPWRRSPKDMNRGWGRIVGAEGRSERATPVVFAVADAGVRTIYLLRCSRDEPTLASRTGLPRSNSSRSTSRCPSWAARNRAVAPSLDCQSRRTWG
jgi:hypothetical protein